MIDDRWLPISQALVAWLAVQPAVVSLGLKAVEIDPSLEPHPRYPVDPVAYCDRLVLRNYTADNEYETSRGTRMKYSGSLWLYKLQVPGQVHQVELASVVRVLTRTIQAAITPPPLQQAGADYVLVRQGSFRDQLRHRFDEPRLRVSVAELLLESHSNTH